MQPNPWGIQTSPRAKVKLRPCNFRESRGIQSPSLNASGARMGQGEPFSLRKGLSAFQTFVGDLAAGLSNGGRLDLFRTLGFGFGHLTLIEPVIGRSSQKSLQQIGFVLAKS